ncbi:MAG: ATP-binding protein [Deltaproteobacteria bacterium]|nr:ATP-binding protein [Deltaproteobacteria bacterium]
MSSDALLAALSWVDLVIFAEVQRVRARGRALSKDAPWGAYIGEAEVDEILGDLLDIGPFRVDDDISGGLRKLLETRREEVLTTRAAEAEAQGSAPLTRLAAAFDLDDTDLDLLLLCLAPEVNARYLRLFAYLQDDFSAQQLTPSLAARMLADDRGERLALGARFAPESRLVRNELVVFRDANDGRTALPARPLSVAPRIARWLLQAEVHDPDLLSWTTLEPVDPEAPPARKTVAAAVEGVMSALPASARSPVLRLDARSQRDALVAARHLARTRQAPLLVADYAAAERLGVRTMLQASRLARETRLQGAVLLLMDPPPAEDGIDPLAPLLLATVGAPEPILLHNALPGVAEPIGHNRRFLALSLPGMTLAERESAWADALKALRKDKKQKKALSDLALTPYDLARRYRYSRGQVAQVVELAKNRAAARGLPHIMGEDVIASAADAFLPDMGPLAQRIPVRRGWDDLVVPKEAGVLLQELVAQVDRREEVLEALGRSNVRDGERGIKALFSGPPGTGKTLSAEVIAQALGYPLFRVDLASVVSKWVGETEKHLNRLFDAVEEAPCVLLFDEADALFGKRADVKGAQDRFANLEVSYLLQRIESFDGIAILTTNLKRNIDEAFLRRFTFVVDFPFPEAEQRLRIWQRVLPEAFPLAEGVDLRAVASDFKLAGANIWSVAVAASCDAAATPERRITKAMLAHAVLREYQKLGREVSALRPSMLAGTTKEEGDDENVPKRSIRGRRVAMSAAEARRVREAQGKRSK